MDRAEILEKARECVCESREEEYGPPENNFQVIASLWSAYMSGRFDCPVDIEPKDVPAMLVLVKVARIASGHAKDDNWVDIAGYAACGGEIESEAKPLPGLFRVIQKIAGRG